MSDWDAGLYLAFGDERTRPARELLGRVACAAPATVVDLGCGPGNSTALLAARWPAAAVIGIDSSPDMLARARADLPALRWELADVATWQPAAPVDVVFANAVLQWLPDHAALLPRLLAAVAPGGALAVQMPESFAQPSHVAMRELWTEPSEARGPLPHRDTSSVLAASAYYDLLAPHAARVDLWHTTYEQVMPDADAIVRWVSGTGLRPFLDALPDPDERAAFVAAYTARIAALYPARADGQRLFSFSRLFIVASR